MKAGVLLARDDIRYEEVQTPEPKAGEVLVKVKYSGICGSDVPRVNEDGAHFYPIILGHEFSGIVEAVGDGVTKVKKGQRVAGAPLVPCMKCEDCMKGDYALCKDYSCIGTRQAGSYAEYICLPEQNVVPFKDTVSFEQGALFEPAAVALHGLECLPYEGGKTVAVLGGGTIGLLVMQWANIFGSAKTVVFDIDDEKIELAKQLGAADGVNTLKEGFMEKAMELTDQKGYDYIFETAGSTVTMKMAYELAANKAGICYIGKPTRELTFTVKEWESDEETQRRYLRF